MDKWTSVVFDLETTSTAPTQIISNRYDERYVNTSIMFEVFLSIDTHIGANILTDCAEECSCE